MPLTAPPETFGTSSVAHLDENLEADTIHLTNDQYAALDKETR